MRMSYLLKKNRGDFSVKITVFHLGGKKKVSCFPEFIVCVFLSLFMRSSDALMHLNL